MHKLDYRGRWLELFGNVLLISVLATLTLGIYLPWGYARYQRTILTKTHYKDQPLQFDGTGGQVFVQFLIIAALSLLTLGLYAILGFASTRMLRWQYSHTIMPTGQRLEYRGSAIDLFFEQFLVGLFTILTLGIYTFWGVVQIRRFVLSRTYLDGKPLDFEGTGVQYLVLSVVNFLLTVVTLGFFSILQFATVRVLRWDARNTTVPEPERASRPMPAYSAPSNVPLGVMPMEDSAQSGYQPELPSYGGAQPSGYPESGYQESEYAANEYDETRYEDPAYGASRQYPDSQYAESEGGQTGQDRPNRSSIYSDDYGDEYVTGNYGRGEYDDEDDETRGRTSNR